MYYSNIDIHEAIDFAAKICETDFEDATIFEKYKKFIESIRDKPDIKNNVFSLLEHKMHGEVMHSSIISFLLKSDIKIMKAFIEILPNVDFEKNYKNACSYCERDRIDVSIKDKISKHAIIIENKINWAVDQKRQLYRYFENLTEKEYTVDAIVYLVPSSSKNPDYTSYESDEKKTVENLLVKIVCYDGSENDLYSKWIKKLENVDIEYKTKSNLIQYGDLLKLKGVAAMNEPILEKFYEEIIKREGSYKHALFMHDMMTNIRLARRNYIEKELKSKSFTFFKDISQEFRNDENGGSHYICCSNKELNISISFYDFGLPNRFQAFLEWDSKSENKMKDVINNFSEEYFTEDKSKYKKVNKESEYIYIEMKSFNLPDDESNIINTRDSILSFVEKLDKDFNDLTISGKL